MVVKLDTRREQKRPPAQKPPPVIDDDESGPAPLDMEEARLKAYLAECGYGFNDIDGLYRISSYNNGKALPIMRAHVKMQVRRNLFDTSVLPGQPAEVQDTSFSALIYRLDKQRWQPLDFSNQDISDPRKRAVLKKIHVAPPPHASRMNDFVHLLSLIAHYDRTPEEARYDASGLLETPGGTVFLNPYGPALTPEGMSAEYQVSYAPRVRQALQRVPFGWERTSTPAEAAKDFLVWFRGRDIAPSSPAYGYALLGVAGFAPLSQRSVTGGAHMMIVHPTGAYKTMSALAVAQQPYAQQWGRRETVPLPMRDAKTTYFAASQVLYYHAGLVVVVDDLWKRTATPAQIDKGYQVASLIARHGASQSPELRGQWGEGDGGFARSYLGRCSTVSTAEVLHDAANHLSDLGAFAILQLDSKTAIDTTLLTWLQAEEHAHAMNRACASFIQFLLPRMGYYLDAARMGALADAYAGHARSPDAYAKIETGLTALLDYGVFCGALTRTEADAHQDKAHALLVGACKAQEMMLGNGHAIATRDDYTADFLDLLLQAHREGHLFMTRPTLKEVNEQGRERGAKAHIPDYPDCLDAANMATEETGWYLHENNDGSGDGWYTHKPHALESGVLTCEEGHQPRLRFTYRMLEKHIYATVQPIGERQGRPLPPLQVLIQHLQREKLLSHLSVNTWLHGRHGIRGHCYTLTFPEEQKPPEGSDSTPTDSGLTFKERLALLPEADLPQEACEQCGKMVSDFRATPDGKLLCVDCAGAPPDRPEGGPGGADRPGEAYQEAQEAQEASQAPEATAGAEAPEGAEVSNGADGAEASSVPTDQEAQRPRVSFPSRQRKAAYLDVGTGRGVLDDGKHTLTGAPGADLSRIVRALPPEVSRVYLCGERPGADGTLTGMQAWADAGEVALYPDWQQQKRGHYFPLTENDTLEDEPVLRFQHQETGRKLELRRMAVWLDGEEYTPEEARAMHHTLWSLLQETFDRRAILMGTPKQTGLELWGHHEYGICHYTDFPALDEETQALIRSTSGQGRIELCPPPVGTLPALYDIDGIFMYGGLTNGLGSGPVTVHDTKNEYAGYTPGRYRIRFTVPEDWRHVGLFMVQAPDGEAWEKPCTPGYTGETWVDGAELHAAYQAQERTGSDWHITILERLLLTPPAKGGHGPLYGWAQKLIGLRESLPDRERSGQLDARTSQLVKSGIRAIVLHSIGGFHATGHDVTRRTLDASQAPANNPTVLHRGRFWTWQEREKLTDTRFQHPEWSAAIWGRCRSRVLLHQERTSQGKRWVGALTMPRDSIVAFETDCIIASMLPEWADGTRAGQFRVKGRIDGKVKTPATLEQLNRTRARMKPEGK